MSPAHPGYCCTVGQPFTSSGILLSTADSPPPDRDPWADAIASATAHVRPESPGAAEGRGAGDSTEAPRILLVAAGILITVGVAVGVQMVEESDPAALSRATQAADLRQEALALIDQIEAYRTERGELPDPSLLDPYLEEGYEYRVIDAGTGRYLVRRTAGGVTVTYDGSLPLGLWLVIGGRETGDSS